MSSKITDEKIVEYFQTMGDGIQKNFQIINNQLGLIRLLLVINIVALIFLFFKI